MLGPPPKLDWQSLGRGVKQFPWQPLLLQPAMQKTLSTVIYFRLWQAEELQMIARILALRLQVHCVIHFPVQEALSPHDARKHST